MTTPDSVVTVGALVGFEARLKGWIDARFDDLALSIKLEINGALDAGVKRLDRLEIEYHMVKAGMARIEADIALLKSAYGDLTLALEDVRTDVGVLKTDIAALRGEFRQHRSDLARVEAETAWVKAAVTRLEQGQAESQGPLHGEISAVRRRVDDLETRVQELGARIDSR